MTYVSPNFNSRATLQRALANKETIEVFEPGLGTVPESGTVWLEGPHYPEPHQWYAKGIMKDGKLKSVS